MKNKEIIFYNNYYDSEREMKVRESLYEEFAAEENWETFDDVPDERIEEELISCDDSDWDNLKWALNSAFKKSCFILTGTCGRWDGNYDGGRFIHNFNDLHSAISHLDYLKFYECDGHFYIKGSHHDSDDFYELKRLTNKGYEYADKNYFAHDKKLHNTIMKCNFYSALPRVAKILYGV